MQIAVTGGLGRLGRYVVRALGSHEVRVLDIGADTECVQADLRDIVALRTALRSTEVVVHLGESGVESIANLLALQGARRSVDCDFRNDLGNIECAFVALESGTVLDIVIDLVGDQAHVGAQRVRGETEFDELEGEKC